jgi:hypothetical protein
LPTPDPQQSVKPVCGGGSSRASLQVSQTRARRKSSHQCFRRSTRCIPSFRLGDFGDALLISRHRFQRANVFPRPRATNYFFLLSQISVPFLRTGLVSRQNDLARQRNIPPTEKLRFAFLGESRSRFSHTGGGFFLAASPIIIWMHPDIRRDLPFLRKLILMTVFPPRLSYVSRPIGIFTSGRSRTPKAGDSGADTWSSNRALGTKPSIP